MISNYAKIYRTYNYGIYLYNAERKRHEEGNNFENFT